MDDDNNEDITLGESNEEIKEKTSRTKSKAKQRGKKLVKKYKRIKGDNSSDYNDGGAKKVIEKINNRNNEKKAQEKAGKTIENAGRTEEVAGRSAEAAGKSMKATGKGMQVAGKGMQKGGEAIAEGSKAAGKAISAIPYVGPVLGAGVTGTGTLVGKGTEAAGKATESAGKATEKAGEATEQSGKRLKESGQRTKKSGKDLKKNGKNKAKKEVIKKFVIANIVPILIIIGILLLIFFLTVIILFFITMPGMMLGKIDDWGREILGNIQGIFTGDSTTAKISAEEIVSLAEHLERMGYDVQAYGLGTVKYKDDGKTTSLRNGKSQEIEEITKNVEGKEYLRSYIAANENTYVLSQYSILGAFTSDIHNIGEIFNFEKDKDFTVAQDYSTGMIDIVGNAGDFLNTSNSTFAEINRNTKQLKIYSNAINLGIIGEIKEIFTGNPNIQWGEAFSYDLNNWVGRYGRPTELSLALHLSTMMPDLPYEIATGQNFNTKVKIGLMDTKVIYDVTATKETETITGEKIKKYYNQYVSGNGDDTVIPGTPWTTKEIAELEEIRNKGEGELPEITGVVSSGSTQETNNANSDILTDTSIKKDEFISKIKSYQQKINNSAMDFPQHAEVVYDVCVKNGINPVICAAQGMVEQGWQSPNIAKNNFWGLGILPTGENVYGSRKADDYVQLWCDRLNSFMTGKENANYSASEAENDHSYAITKSEQYAKEDSEHFSGNVNSIYEVYAAYNGFDHASETVDYVDNNVLKFVKEIFGEGRLNRSDSSRNTTSTGSSSDGGTFLSNSTESGNFKKYNLNESQLAQLTFVAYREQGTDAGAAAEASLMANLFESSRGNGYGEGADGLVNYVLTGGWFAAASTGSSDYDENHKNVVRKVLVDGKRTLPIYVDEHDCLSDITSVSNTSVSNRSGYIKDVSVIHNRFGSTYTFYEFPGGEASGTDPFGYTSKHGSDFCYSFDGSSSSGMDGIVIKWPFIAQVTNHWFYDDIDFMKGVYRLAKVATKKIDYKPEDEEDILNKNKVDVTLDASLGSSQGIIYQVAEPETNGPNDRIKELFNQEYYKYDGTINTAEEIENARAIEAGETKYRFNGEEKYVDATRAQKVKKEKVDFKENKTESLAAFGILENMHTEASDYVYRNLKELVIALKYFTTQELTEDLKNILLWPVKTDYQNTKWETAMDERNFSAIIKCSDKENEIVAPSNAKIKKIKGNEITLEFIDLDDESYELLNYIYQGKDPYKKINRELVSGMKLEIKDIQVKGVSVGDTVKRGDKLGTAIGKTDGKNSIRITMYNLDKSVDLNNYFRQEENTKYEELMKIKKDSPAEYKEGLDITPLLNGGTLGGSGAGTAVGTPANVLANVKEFVERALSVEGANYIISGYIWTGNIATSYFTCSGLVDFALGNEPRTNSPETFYEEVWEKGNLVTDDSKLKYGDLLFYSYAGRNPGHVAIYIGDGKEIDADGSRVAIHELRWMSGYMGGGTYLN